MQPACGPFPHLCKELCAEGLELRRSRDPRAQRAHPRREALLPAFHDDEAAQRCAQDARICVLAVTAKLNNMSECEAARALQSQLPELARERRIRALQRQRQHQQYPIQQLSLVPPAEAPTLRRLRLVVPGGSHTDPAGSLPLSYHSRCQLAESSRALGARDADWAVLVLQAAARALVVRRDVKPASAKSQETRIKILPDAVRLALMLRLGSTSISQAHWRSSAGELAEVLALSPEQLWFGGCAEVEVPPEAGPFAAEAIVSTPGSASPRRSLSVVQASVLATGSRMRHCALFEAPHFANLLLLEAP